MKFILALALAAAGPAAFAQANEHAEHTAPQAQESPTKPGTMKCPMMDHATAQSGDKSDMKGMRGRHKSMGGKQMPMGQMCAMMHKDAPKHPDAPGGAPGHPHRP